MTTSTGEDNVIRLHDGRALGYAEYGDLSGGPLFFFHGMPGSRYGGALLDEAARRAGVRVISPDRPGFGLSDYKSGRTILDWVDDVADLTDALRLDQFAVAGVSSGGMYVAACALRTPQRLTSAHIISGAGPMNAPGATEGMMTMNKVMWTLYRRAPFVADGFFRLLARMARRNPDRATSGALARMPEADRRLFEQPEIASASQRDFVEAFRSGWRGAAHDGRLSARPWGFRLENIRMKVRLWQGEEDRNVPPAMGRYQARAIPDCDARFFSGEGHMLMLNHLDELMAIVVNSR